MSKLLGATGDPIPDPPQPWWKDKQTVLQIVTLLGALLATFQGWLSQQAAVRARLEAGQAAGQAERNGDHIRGVDTRVKAVQARQRVAMGLPPGED